MAIADIGLQIRDSNVPQLLLEYGVGVDTTFEVNSIGQLLVTPAGAEELFIGTHFQIVPPLNANANLKLATTGTGVGVIDADSNALNIRVAAVDQLVIADEGFTIAAGTGKLQVGASPQNILLQPIGVDQSGVLEIAPSGLSSIADVQLFNNSDQTNSGRFIVSLNGGVALLRIDASVGVPVTPITNFEFVGGPIAIPRGLVTEPSLYFTGDTTTGLYTTGVGVMRFAVSGALVLTLGSTLGSLIPIHAPNGGIGAPSFSFGNDATSGMFLNAGGDVRISAIGIGTYAFQSTQLIPLLPIRHNQDGVVGAPSYSFLTASSMGMFNNAGSLELAVGGDTRFRMLADGRSEVSNTLHNDVLIIKRNTAAGVPSLIFWDDVQLIFSIRADGATNNWSLINHVVAGGSMFLQIANDNVLQLSPGLIKPFYHILGIAGTEVNPSYSFVADSGSGMRQEAPAVLNFSVASVQVLRIDPASFRVSSPQVLVNAGTVALPGYGFTGAENSGMWSTSGQVRLTVLGVDSLILTGGQALTNNGVAANPGWSFVAESSSGMFLHGAGSLRFASAGSINLVLEAGSVYPGTTSAFVLGTDAYRWSTGYFDNLVVTNPPWTTAFPLLAPDGTVAAPVYTFLNDATSGMWRSASLLHFSVLGAERFRFGDGINQSFGSLNPGSPNAYSLGADGARWGTLYVNDLVVTNPPWGAGAVVVSSGVTAALAIGNMTAGQILDISFPAVGASLGDLALINPTVNLSLVNVTITGLCVLNGEISMTLHNAGLQPANFGTTTTFNYLVFAG